MRSSQCNFKLNLDMIDSGEVACRVGREEDTVITCPFRISLQGQEVLREMIRTSDMSWLHEQHKLWQAQKGRNTNVSLTEKRPSTPGSRKDRP